MNNNLNGKYNLLKRLKYPQLNNNKIQNEINTHIKWRDFISESPSGLHCRNQYGSLNHLIGRSSNRQCIGSSANTNPSLLQRVRISSNRSERCNTQSNPWTHMNIHRTHTHTHQQYINFILYHQIQFHPNIVHWSNLSMKQSH